VFVGWIHWHDTILTLSLSEQNGGCWKLARKLIGDGGKTVHSNLIERFARKIPPESGSTGPTWL